MSQANKTTSSNGKTTRPQQSRKEMEGEHLYNLRQAMERFERGYLNNILELVDWNITEAAELLDISVSTLRAKIKKYGIRMRQSM